MEIRTAFNIAITRNGSFLKARRYVAIPVRATLARVARTSKANDPGPMNRPANEWWIELRPQTTVTSRKAATKLIKHVLLRAAENITLSSANRLWATRLP